MTARNWKDVRADAVSAGRINEARVQEIQGEMLDAQRAHRLAAVRKARGITQDVVGATMGVAQSRVSAIERGALRSTELGTLSAYVEALGGHLRLVADFGDTEMVVGDASQQLVTEVARSPVDAVELRA